MSSPFLLPVNEPSINQYTSMATTTSNEETPAGFREKLIKLFHSYRFHLLIIALVIIDCLIVVTELIIELNVLNKECKEETPHSSSEVLSVSNDLKESGPQLVIHIASSLDQYNHIISIRD
ncbi:voltage-gated hydrogen channel 1-like protein, partial [Dinothrombium tinctorium]